MLNYTYDLDKVQHWPLVAPWPAIKHLDRQSELRSLAATSLKVNDNRPGCQTMIQFCWSKSLHAMGESDRKPLAKLLLRTLPFGISICLFKFYFTNHSPDQPYPPSNQNNIYNLVRSAHSETSTDTTSVLHTYSSNWLTKIGFGHSPGMVWPRVYWPLDKLV